MDQALNSQKTPHTSPLRASYGMSFVSILMKNNRVIKGFYCSTVLLYIYKKIFKIALIVVYSSPQLDESHAGNLISGFSDSQRLSDYNSQKRDFLNKGIMPDAFDGLTRAIIQFTFCSNSPVLIFIHEIILYNIFTSLKIAIENQKIAIWRWQILQLPRTERPWIRIIRRGGTCAKCSLEQKCP